MIYCLPFFRAPLNFLPQFPGSVSVPQPQQQQLHQQQGLSSTAAATTATAAPPSAAPRRVNEQQQEAIKEQEKREKENRDMQELQAWATVRDALAVLLFILLLNVKYLTFNLDAGCR